jgi:hypothetical protein
MDVRRLPFDSGPMAGGLNSASRAGGRQARACHSRMHRQTGPGVRCRANQVNRTGRAPGRDGARRFPGRMEPFGREPCLPPRGLDRVLRRLARALCLKQRSAEPNYSRAMRLRRRPALSPGPFSAAPSPPSTRAAQGAMPATHPFDAPALSWVPSRG